MDTEQRRDELPLAGDNSEQWQKLKNMMLAHLDGVYVFSARENCDQLVTQLIQYLVSAEHRLQALSTQPAVQEGEVKERIIYELRQHVFEGEGYQPNEIIAWQDVERTLQKCLRTHQLPSVS